MMTPLSPDDLPHVVLSRQRERIILPTLTEQTDRLRRALGRAAWLSTAALLAPMLAAAAIAMLHASPTQTVEPAPVTLASSR